MRQNNEYVSSYEKYSINSVQEEWKLALLWPTPLFPQQLLNIRCHPPESLQLIIFLQEMMIARFCSLYRSNHQVPIGMFSRDKLNHIGLITHDPQHQCPERISQNVGHPLLQYAM